MDKTLLTHPWVSAALGVLSGVTKSDLPVTCWNWHLIGKSWSKADEQALDLVFKTELRKAILSV